MTSHSSSRKSLGEVKMNCRLILVDFLGVNGDLNSFPSEWLLDGFGKVS